MFIFVCDRRGIEKAEGVTTIVLCRKFSALIGNVELCVL